jgi:hypothetical protein
METARATGSGPLLLHARCGKRGASICRRRPRETVIQKYLEHLYFDRVLSTQWLSTNPVFRESL